MRSDDGTAWALWWNLGILVGLVGVPAMLGFLVGVRIEASTATRAPWGLILALLGVLVGALAAWRALTPARGRTRD